MLVCSSGGHLQEMARLRPAFDGYERTWVTLEGSDVEHLLSDEDVVIAHGPTNRSIRKLLRNMVVAWRVVRRRRPQVIISTGAALAVPFFVFGKLFGARLIFIESLARVTSLSLSGRLVYPLADRFFVQWPEATAKRERAIFRGSVL